MKLVEVIVLLIADQIAEFVAQTFEETFILNEFLHLTTSEWKARQLQTTLCINIMQYYVLQAQDFDQLVNVVFESCHYIKHTNYIRQ